MNDCEQLKSDFEKFLLFQCENKSIDPDDLIHSTINLIRNCVSAKEAILQFYYQLFDELCLLYINKQSLEKINTGHLLQRFLDYYQNESDSRSQNFKSVLIYFINSNLS